MKKIGFIGLGKLGLDCAEVFATQYEVYGYDVDPRVSDSVTVSSLRDTVESSDWIFVAVPTPHQSGYDGSTPSSHLPPVDFQYDTVVSVLKQINLIATQPKKVVLISTVLPGTTRHQFGHLLDDQHSLLYNPYLIAMGSVKWDMVNPEMIMIGTHDGNCNGVAQDLVDLYAPLVTNKPRIQVGTWEECEAIKIFYNTFISAKIGLVNMIQDFAMRIGNIDVDVVTTALADSTMRIMGPKYMTAGMGDAGACHPRDNIALRWLAQEYDLGYDMFDTIMQARELQSKNLADFLVRLAQKHNLPIAIHGKAYKPDVPYCIGSYSTLIGHYIKQAGHRVQYVDPLADDPQDLVTSIDRPAVILMAHNRKVTYGYTGQDGTDQDYCKFLSGSIVVDPWRREPTREGIQVIHYGNTRNN